MYGDQILRICLWILGLKGLRQPQNPYISTKDIKNRSPEKDGKGEAKSVWLLITGGGGLPNDGDRDTHHLRWRYDYGLLSGWKTTLVDRSPNYPFSV